tara:strand:+ start:1020 stop:1739 length:720 start_codon:yes stop_codon:yes gene_type:complete
LKAAITQPNFLPWIGYFDLLDEVDLFVALDNVQCVNRSFIVRNRIKSPNGDAKWLTVNLNKVSRSDLINQVTLKEGAWYQSHIDKIKSYYHKAPYFEKYFDLIGNALIPRTEEKTLESYNIRLIQFFADILNIETRIVKASDAIQNLEGEAEDKILQLCKFYKVSDYYNFQKGVDVGLYHPEHFANASISLNKHIYNHPEYNQIHGDFLPYLSIVDLLFNEGDKSFEILKSGSKWEQLA